MDWATKVTAETDAEAEEIFVAAVEHALTLEPVFVVVGLDALAPFVARLNLLCEVVVDHAVAGSALIVAGASMEWPELRSGLDEVLGSIPSP